MYKYTYIRKLSLFHYNIGFLNFDQDLLSKEIPDIKWMKHNYRDRFFADPFILNITDDEIKVVVEDFEYRTWLGSIALLTIDRKSLELKSRKIILELDTHLSFPFVFRRNEDELFIIPENSASGSLSAYRFDTESETVKKVSILTDMPVIDPVIHQMNGHYYLYGTLRDREENANLYAWESSDPLEGYSLLSEHPVKTDICSGRRGGGFFTMNDELYSATQYCKNKYGEALSICKCTISPAGELSEDTVFRLKAHPLFPYGIHTLNIHQGLCVVDGLKYLFNPVGKIRGMIRKYRRAK